jgi:hypothetical protein
MRRSLVLFVTSSLLLAASASFAQQSRIDQEQPAVNNTGPALSIGGSLLPFFGRKLAQVFTPAVTGSLTHVTVPVACEAGAQLTVQIQTAFGGLPSGGVITSESATGETYPPYTHPYSTTPDAGFRLVQFYSRPHVDADQEYAIVLLASGKCSILSAPAGDFYARGRAYYQGLSRAPGWIPLAPNGPSDDLSFQTFVDTTPPVIF